MEIAVCRATSYSLIVGAISESRPPICAGQDAPPTAVSSNFSVSVIGKSNNGSSLTIIYNLRRALDYEAVQNRNTYP